MAQRKGRAAQVYFSKASSIDSADPYAHLGWGMALIQQGHLEQGREHLELAVVLDPANSLLRSYLGKGYFEEDRLKLAETQLNLAQTLDPNDPTPWYYLSQVKHDQNHYGEALQLIETAIDKNANRAVYRQDGALDSDEATRLADKARIYQAMGAEQLAINTASDAIRAAPNDYAGHRAMAIALTGKEGAQTARANEALQASLLAPIGATPLAPGFAETAMQVLPGAGPHEIGINEYNAAFTPNGINGFVSALGAGNNTRATEGQVQLVSEKTDLSVGQYHYSSDGFRENNDRDYLVNEGRLKYQIIDPLLIELVAIDREDDLGDLSDQIVNAEYSKTSRKIKKKESYSFGFNYSISDFIHLTGYRSTKRISNIDFSEDFFPWGDSVKTEIPYIAKPTVTAFVSQVDSNFGTFSVGYKQAKMDEIFGGIYIDVIDGIQQEPFVDELQPEQSKVKQYFVDYLYSGENFYVGLGIERTNVDKLILAPLDDTYFSGELGFDCSVGFECKFVHKEFLTSSGYAGESVRNQSANVFAGRSDYLPFTKVEIDGVGVEKNWPTLNLFGNFQRSEVSSPFYATNQYVSPDLEEREYSFGLNSISGWVDVVAIEYSFNKSSAFYNLGMIARSDIPNLFKTELFEL
ncbi:MAG: hypothetical protein EOO68_15995, partial [Moraxellaceae bacterium]